MDDTNNHSILRCRRLALLAVVSALLTGTGCASDGASATAGLQPHHPGSHANHQAPLESMAEPKLSREELEADWGIELLGIRRTAANYALHFRYRVLDVEKAAPLLQKKLSRNPHLIVEKSGAMLRVPFSEKVGTMRQSVRTVNQIKPGRTYFALFANPGRHVEAGDQVTVVIGDFRAPHIVVE